MDLGSCFQEDVGLLASSLKWISATALAGEMPMMGEVSWKTVQIWNDLIVSG
jgi:hypothetical protein